MPTIIVKYKPKQQSLILVIIAVDINILFETKLKTCKINENVFKDKIMIAANENSVLNLILCNIPEQDTYQGG